MEKTLENLLCSDHCDGCVKYEMKSVINHCIRKTIMSGDCVKAYNIMKSISMYKNESLFPLATASRVNDWTDFAKSFFESLLVIRTYDRLK